MGNQVSIKETAQLRPEGRVLDAEGTEHSNSIGNKLELFVM